MGIRCSTYSFFIRRFRSTPQELIGEPTQLQCRTSWPTLRRISAAAHSVHIGVRLAV